MIGPFLWLIYLFIRIPNARYFIADDALVLMVWGKHGFQRRKSNFNGKFVAYVFPENIGGSKGKSGHAPIMVLGRACPPFHRLQKELLKVGGSWRSAVFFAPFTCDYIKNISVIQAYI